MSTKTIGVVGRGSGWQKVGIELGSCVFYPNSSQPGMFQTFAEGGSVFRTINKMPIYVMNFKFSVSLKSCCNLEGDIYRQKFGTSPVGMSWD